MSAGRWIVVYTLGVCSGIVLFSQGWWAILGAFMIYISIVGIVTNARRLE